MFFIVNHKHKVLIGWSPKCGCTTIKEYYLEAIGIKRKNKVEVHHDPDVQQHVHHSVLKKQDLNKLDKYRKVLLIRNPYKRVISGYLQRIVMNKTLYDTRFREKDYANDGKINTFNKFIDTMLNNRKHVEDNHHFDQQCTHNYNVFQNRKWKWDFVMDLDNLDSDIVKLNKMLNTSVKLNEMNKVKHTEIHVEKAYDLTIKQLLALDGMPSYESFFNEQIINKIGKIYKLDLDNFKKWGHQYKVPVRKNNPIIMCGQGGSRTRLIAQIFKEMKNTYLIESSEDTYDSIALRQSKLHDYVRDMLMKNKTCNYNPVNDNHINDSMRRFIHLLDQEKCNFNKIWGWKEPFSRHYLPYLYKEFPKMRVIYIKRDTVPSEKHIEGETEVFDKIFEGQYKEMSYDQKFRMLNNKLDKSCIDFFKEKKIDHIVINTDQLLNSKFMKNEMDKMAKFLNTSYNYEKCQKLIVK